MKKIFTILYLSFSFLIKGQTFTGVGGPIQDNGQDTYFPLNISGLVPAQIDSTFGMEQVCIKISHPDVRELYITLMSPNGVIVELSEGSSISGPDYLNTCFNDQAGTSITLGTAPFSGNYKPVGYLGRFNTGQTGNGNWTLIVHDGYPFSNAGTLASWSLTFGTTPAHPVIFNSSNLPIVFINDAQPITDFSTTATMGIVDNGTNRNYVTDAWNGYNGKTGIKLHGSTSKNYPKKSFGIETHDATGNNLSVPQLGMPAESDWILCASYADKTLLRNELAYDLFRQMGHYAPRYRNVEVVINSEYRGVYAFLEKIKHDSNRVNIKKMGANDNVFPDYTGGYILNIDRTDEAGWYSQLPGNCPTGAKFYYQYVYPNDVSITSSQISYIQSYMNSFETMMNSSAYADPNTGYPKFIDVSSFIDVFIINELGKNVDGFRLSSYLYKDNIDQGGKIHAGPVWDYDFAFHNCNYGNAFDAMGWEFQSQDCSYPVPMWWIRLMQDPDFTNKLHCRWNDLRQNILSISYLNNYVDAGANALAESQQRNFRQWPVMGAYIYPNPQNQSGASYSTEIADLKTWLANRIAWLDANIAGACAIGINEQVLANSLNVYPNPTSANTTFSFKLSQNSDVSLCVTDLVGKEVARYLKANVLQGDSKIVFERDQIQSGVYLYQLQVNNMIKTGKIIIQ